MTTWKISNDSWLNSLITANSLLKVIAFLLLWAVIWSPIAFSLKKLVGWHGLEPLTPKQKLPILASLYLIAPLALWIAATLEGASFSQYGLDWQLGSLLRGMGIGVGGIGIIFAWQTVFNLVAWHPENSDRLLTNFLPILAIALGVGFVEELVFRGFFLYELQQNYSFWLAAAISSTVFALLHLVWERQETLPQLPGLWLMGMILVGARAVDGGSLALPWGLHGGWIWGLACLDAAELVAYPRPNLAWLTGIKGHPLAGVAGILCLLGTGAVLWIWK